MPIPTDSVKISSSINGKVRIITKLGLNIRLDIEQITLLTIRRFFEVDINDIDGVGVELTGLVDFPAYEKSLIADNSANHLCNPNNGVACYPTTSIDGQGNEIISYMDALGNIVISPIGFFDFFKPFLSQPTAIFPLMDQNIIAEDQIYHTWNK